MARVRELSASALAPLSDDPDSFAAMVKPAQDTRFGDYQANCAMPLAKRREPSAKAPDVAREIIGRLELADLCEVPEVAGPGFINLRLRTDWLAGQVQRKKCGEAAEQIYRPVQMRRRRAGLARAQAGGASCIRTFS